MRHGCRSNILCFLFAKFLLHPHVNKRVGGDAATMGESLSTTCAFTGEFINAVVKKL